MSAVG